MPDTDVNFAPPPETLTSDERLAELAQILATAVERAKAPRWGRRSRQHVLEQTNRPHGE